ncbi:MAG: hypothetical protein EOM68_11950 [Spirochaetia bacterium]|nr:hypothetical protein [Spirochaetia bacterium]
MTKKELYFSGEGFGTALLVAALDDFTTELIDWEPETIEMELKDRYGAVPSTGTMDRLEAARGLLASNIFYKDLAAFSTVCRCLNFRAMLPGNFIPADLHDIMWGVTEADVLLGGTDGGDTNFVSSIRIYTGKLLEEQGILDPPRVLRFAAMTKLGMDNQEIADLPDLGGIFEANQADSRKELEDVAVAKLKMMLTQISSLKLEGSNLEEYGKRIAGILNA